MKTQDNSYLMMFLGGIMFYGFVGSLMPNPSPIPCPPTPDPIPVVLKAQGLEVREVSATVYYPTGDPTYDGTTTPKGKALSTTRWCALSHDLLRLTGWQWGDTVLVYGKNLPNQHWGLYILHDKTHSRLRNRIDLLVPNHTYSDKWDGVLVRKFTLKDQDV